MADTIDCARCGETKPALDRRPPLPGDDAELVQSRVCADCWQEWREEEVRTINELRLNFMDPEAQRVLRERMLSYLGLAADGGDGEDEAPACDRS